MQIGEMFLVIKFELNTNTYTTKGRRELETIFPLGW